MGKFLSWLQERIKLWTKPATSVLIIGILSDLTRSHTDLVVENVLLRQQLIGHVETAPTAMILAAKFSYSFLLLLRLSKFVETFCGKLGCFQLCIEPSQIRIILTRLRDDNMVAITHAIESPACCASLPFVLA